MAKSYFTLLTTALTTGDTLVVVTEPKKSASGKWTVKQSSLTLGDPLHPKKVSSITNMYNVNPNEVLEIKSLADVQNNRTPTKFAIKAKIDESIMKSLCSGKDDTTLVRNFMNTIFDNVATVRWLDSNGKNIFSGKLGYSEHLMGHWTITKHIKFTRWVTTTEKGMIVQKKEVEERTSTCNQSSKLKSISKPPQQSTTLDPMNRSTVLSSIPTWNAEETWYTCELTITSTTVLADTNSWELGATYAKSSIDDDYCFYCTDTSSIYHINKFTTTIPLTPSSSASKKHKCSTHGGTPSSTASESNLTNNANASLSYTDKRDLPIQGTGISTGKAVKHLPYGSKGNYVDGVATVPYVIMELRATEDSTTGHSLSFPADSFVSLTHERNLSDGYNTFSLQLFDENALKVESWLLLGFRFIHFYYTDFVATSKRFKGQVMDYKTVITGKGLMLTLSGYTSNSIVYTGKDSIPWKELVEARSFSFYYWLNNAGEYHGTVRVTQAEISGVQQPIFTSTEGEIACPEYLERQGYTDIENAEYYLKYTDSVTQEEKWTTFSDYYSGSESSDLELYKPHPKLWSLEQYNTNLPNELSIDDLGGASSSNIMEPRPSNIVLLICIINGWKWKAEYIHKTRLVTEIPDMVSMSFTEYIKEKLIPISIADGEGGSSQFNFWFDDEGYVHYAPGSITSSGKKLYFNAKEVPDSYPLIAFTAATNGNILMQTDATHTLEAVNIYTGDALKVDQVKLQKGDAYLSTVHTTEEWYATNRNTMNDYNKLYTYSKSNVVPSESDLLKQLQYRYGLISKFTYRASLEVYGCSDITPGETVDIYIYLGDGVRSNSSISKEDPNSNTKYIGNVTMHHSSGRYFVNKITDTISAGRYISQLEVLKIDAGQLELMMGDTNGDTLKVKATSENINKAGTDEEEILPSTDKYYIYRNLIK